MARPTVQDVAKTAGVSVGTVSRVLNDSSAVSASAKEKVNAAIEALSYRPLASARDLKRPHNAYPRPRKEPGLARH